MEKAIKDLREKGLGVIENYISAERCDAVMQEMKRLVEDAKLKLDEQAKAASSNMFFAVISGKKRRSTKMEKSRMPPIVPSIKSAMAYTC